MKWEYVALGDLYEVHNGLSKGGRFFGDGFPFLSFSTVFNKWFLPQELPDLVQSTDKEQQSYSIRRGDVFVTRTSETMDELGMSSVALKDYPHATYNGFTKRLRPINSERILPEFIGYYLRTPFFRAGFAAFSTMTTRASLRNEDLLSMKVPVPDIPTQKRIANILSAYDNLIENDQKQIKLLEEAAQRLYKEWFVDLRFPGYEDTPIVDGVPVGWGKAPIDSRISLLSGYAFKSAQFDSSGEYKIVTIKNVKDGEFDGIDTNRIVSIPGKMPKHCVLADRDILLSLTGNVGRTCIVNGNNYLLNQRVAKLQSDIPAFTYCLFRSSDMFDAMNNLANGAAQQNLSPIRTGKISILFPADNLLEEFERIVGSMISKMLSLRKQCDLLIQARDRLLPKLMSGEIEV